MRSSSRWLVGGVCGVAVVVGLAVAGWAGLFDGWLARSPFAGRWKVTLFQGDHDLTPWLLNISSVAGQPLVTVSSALDQTRVVDVRLGETELHLDLESDGKAYHLTFYRPADDASPQELRGVVDGAGARVLATLVRTERKELDAKKAEESSAATVAFQLAINRATADEAEQALRHVIDQYPDRPARYRAGVVVTALAARRGAEADVRRDADQTVEFAHTFGPSVELLALQSLALEILNSQKMPAVALTYARRAQDALPADAPPAQAVPILKTLAAALRQAGQDEEAKTVDARLERMEELLDEEFRRDGLPFQTEPYTPPDKGTGKAVLVELFTGVHCPPCVAADLACDGLLQTFPGGVAVLLEYHLHAPSPDPLTNPDGIARGAYYQVEGTPALFLDGTEVKPAGGLREHAGDRYRYWRGQVRERLRETPRGRVQLKAVRTGDQLELSAEYADLAAVGDDVRLRLVLVEDEVRYLGFNRQRFHRHVVRGFPGGVQGFALKEKSGKETVTQSLAKLTEGLRAYLTDFATANRLRRHDLPLDLKRLKAIAFIQDDRTREVWNAVQAEVK